jgi:putative YphP/YqiW family bacilliredoxin
MMPLQRPTYDTASVLPMRRELEDVGFTQLMTPQAVEDALLTPGKTQGITLVVINSVCGCAAGSARPGVALALQNDFIPDHLYTVFAGMEKAAVDRVREILAPHPASSPSMAIFKDGRLVRMFHRRDFEVRSAIHVAGMLSEAFNELCSKAGPSISPDIFARLESEQFCGSTLPLYQG